MIELYTVNNKIKSNIKGFWKNENKIFRDNIFVKTCYSLSEFENEKAKLFESGELAVFYKSDRIAKIEDKNGKIDILLHSKKQRFYNLKASHVKKLLNTYGGITVIKENNTYLIEVNY